MTLTKAWWGSKYFLYHIQIREKILKDKVINQTLSTADVSKWLFKQTLLFFLWLPLLSDAEDLQENKCRTFYHCQLLVLRCLTHFSAFST